MLSYIKGGSCEYAFWSYAVDKAQEILLNEEQKCHRMERMYARFV